MVGLGGLVALSSLGKIPKTYQEFEERQAQLDEQSRKALALAALGGMGGQGGGQMPPQMQAPPQAAPPQYGQQPSMQRVDSQPLPPPQQMAAPGGAPPGVNYPTPQPGQGQGIPMWASGSMPLPPQLQRPFTQDMGLGTGPGMPPAGPAQQMPGAPNAPPLAGPQAPGQQPPMQASLGAQGGGPASSPSAPPQVAGAPPGPGSSVPGAGGMQAAQPEGPTPAQQRELTGAMQTMIARGLVPQGGFQWQQLAQQLVQANPQLKNRPDVIGQALLMAAPLMNQGSMMQFRELQLQQRMMENQLRHQEAEERIRIQQEKLDMARLGAETPEGLERLAKQAADYNIDASTLPKHIQPYVMDRASQIAKERGDEEPWNAGKFKTQQRAINEFNVGVSGRGTQSISTAYKHLDTLEQLGKNLNNWQIPLTNEWKNWFVKAFGLSTAPTTFEAAKQVVVNEIIKGISGVSGGALHDRQEAANNIAAALNPEQMRDALNAYRELLRSQLEGFETRYREGTGRKDFYKHFGLPEPGAGAHGPAGGGGGGGADPFAGFSIQ